MKNSKQNTEERQARGPMSRFFLTACMLTSITAGWLLGNFTTEAFSQSKTLTPQNVSTTLLSIPVHGETLPTIMLEEFSVIAD